MVSSEQQRKINSFVSTTSQTIKTAETYLNKFGWSLERAVDGFFEDGGALAEPMPNTSTGNEEENKKLLNAWFESYLSEDDDENEMTENGIFQFCDDINVDPQDILVLIISWQMNASTMGIFTRSEWVHGMEKMQVTNTAELKEKLSNIKESIVSPEAFKEFYSFCFRFSKEQGQRSLTMEIAQPLWELLLTDRFPDVAKDWFAFLQTKPCKGITRDTWDLLLDFMIKVESSYSNYDENEAWPVLIDDFMVWVQEKK